MRILGRQPLNVGFLLSLITAVSFDAGLPLFFLFILSGMVKTVIIAWVIWFIYIILLETVAPEAIYKPMENITLTSLIAIPITGHILTFLAIRTNNRKIFSVTHNSQQAILFKRETWLCTLQRQCCPFFRYYCS